MSEYSSKYPAHMPFGSSASNARLINIWDCKGVSLSTTEDNQTKSNSEVFKRAAASVAFTIKTWTFFCSIISWFSRERKRSDLSSMTVILGDLEKIVLK